VPPPILPAGVVMYMEGKAAQGLRFPSGRARKTSPVGRAMYRAGRATGRRAQREIRHWTRCWRRRGVLRACHTLSVGKRSGVANRLEAR
jgi:hypothetical protein